MTPMKTRFAVVGFIAVCSWITDLSWGASLAWRELPLSECPSIFTAFSFGLFESDTP